MSYDALRHFADSWGLLFMALIFVSFAIWSFRPSARGHHRDAKHMIFNEDNSDG